MWKKPTVFLNASDQLSPQMNADWQLPLSEMKPELYLEFFETLTNVTSVQGRGLQNALWF